MKKYMTTGIVVVDQIIPYDKAEKPFSRLGGGAMYALSAFKLWTPDVFLVAYAGKDFEEYFGTWMRENDCSSEGICRVLDCGPKSCLKYQENGIYVPVLSSKWLSGARVMPNMQLLEPHLDGNLKGVHVVAHSDGVFFEQLNKYRKKYGFKVGFEIGNPLDTPEIPELIKEVTDKYVDYFSLSLVEAQAYFPDIRDKKDGIEMCLSLKCPVYFRMGKEGAYLTKDGESYGFPMADEFPTADATGCGNVSTAAAFWALCEGKSPLEAGAIAAVTASLNASYMGLIPRIEPWMKEKCLKYVEAVLTDRI